MAGFQQFGSEDVDESGGRGFGGFTPSTTMGGRTTSQGNPYKYRKDYGWRMTVDQYGTMEGNREKFESTLTNYRKMATDKIKTAQGEYDKANEEYTATISKGRDQLKAAQEQLGKFPSMSKMFDDWYKSEPKVLVKNVGKAVVEKPGTGGAGEGGLYDNAGNMEYKEVVFTQEWAPYSSVKALYENKDAAKLKGVWSKDGKTYTMNQPTRHVTINKIVKQISDPKELKKNFLVNDKVLKNYGLSASQYAKANKDLQNANNLISNYETKQGKALSLAKNQISKAKLARDTAIETEEVKRQAELDVAKAGYEKSRGLRQRAFAGLQNMMWKSGGTTGE